MKRGYQTGDQYLVREMNLSTVMRYLREQAPLSRARLANLTGLNKSTVSSLINALIDRGVVREVGHETPGNGRPGRLLDVDIAAGLIIGVGLGPESITVVLVDIAGQVQWRCEQQVERPGHKDAVIAQAFHIVDDAAATARSMSTRLLGLGLSVPGSVNIVEGKLVQPQAVPYGKIFYDHTKLPTEVDNDANAAAIAEHLFGVAGGTENFIFVLAGVGLGGGLFLNGEIYRGASGFAGRIGHTNFIMEPYRPLCQCGNRGCWEAYANQYSVIERMRARLSVGRGSLVSAKMPDQHAPPTIPLIVQAADQNDAEALEVLSETGSIMGLGVANLINIFNPDMVVMGGRLSEAGKYFIPSIERTVNENILPVINSSLEIRLSAFGSDAGVMGAAALVVERILKKPSSLPCLSGQAK